MVIWVPVDWIFCKGFQLIAPSETSLGPLPLIDWRGHFDVWQIRSVVERALGFSRWVWPHE